MLLWLKALHLISMVAWFAGLFYLFRLFVYQAEKRGRAEVAAELARMAGRLYRIITTPAGGATLLFGLAMLAVQPHYLTLGWLQTKLALVAGLVAHHLHAGRILRRFERKDVYLTPGQCRLRNEAVTLFLVAIVLLAVLRPTVG